MTIKLFISYSHEDAKYKEEIEKHLTPLKSSGLIESWHDEKIAPGEKWSDEIEQHMRESNIILLLFSSDFIYSEACEKEVELAKKLEENEKVFFIPVILRGCLWKKVPGMAKVKALPHDGKPVSQWDDKDEAWLSVCAGIQVSVERIKAISQAKSDADKKVSATSIADTVSEEPEKTNKRKQIEQKLQRNLDKALSYYEGLPIAWTDRVIYKRKGVEHRNAYDDEIDTAQLIRNPYSLLIFDKPISGFTCLARYLVLEAWKKGRNWLYLEANDIPSEKESIEKHVTDACQKQTTYTMKSLRCLVLDGWQQDGKGMAKKLRNLSSVFKDIPLIVMSSGEKSFSLDKEKMKREFIYAGLKPLSRRGIRDIVTEYNSKKNISEEDDIVVGKVVSDMEILNIHRTPEHCLTLLKVYEKSFSETPVNRTKMLSMLLVAVFDMAKTPRYCSDKPDADHCAFVLGFFCEKMIREKMHSFFRDNFLNVSTDFLKERKITLDVNAIFDILHQNKIIIEDGSRYKFRHAFWTYYFAAHRMRQDIDFYKYIMSGEMYLLFPEVIEFFAGIDGNRNDLIEMLAKDLRTQCDNMEDELGIKDALTTPLDLLKRIDDKESVSERFQYVQKKIIGSNLPYSIKDEHADKSYDMSRPDDQSLYKAYKEHKFSSLRYKLHACCRALRNSEFADPDKKSMMMAEIMRGWSLFAKITFLLSPILVKENMAFWEGLGLILDSEMQKIPPKQKLYYIWACTPHNVVGLFEDDLHSDRLSALLKEIFQGEKDRLVQHLLAIFLIRKKPQCWMQIVNGYMKAVKIDSVYYANVHDQLIGSYQYDFATSKQIADMKDLIYLWYARKLDTGGKHGPIGKNLKYKAIKLQGRLHNFPPREVEGDE